MPPEPRPRPVAPSAEVAFCRAYGGKSQPRRGDAEIAALAEQQYGVVERGQLRELGFGNDAIDRRLRTGRLFQVHAGVFAVGRPSLNREGRWMAAVLALGPGAVLSHRSAAALWGLRNHSGGRIDVTVASKSRSPRGIRRHCSPVPADEVGESEDYPGIPVTSVPRTIFDNAASGDADLVESMLRDAERLRLYDPLSLLDLLARYPHRRGCRAVRVALDRVAEAPGSTESPLEESFLPFLRAHGLPIPRLNEWIVLGEGRYRVDCRWPGTREIVELDGWATHGTRAAFRDDRERDRRLRVAGYGMTRIAWSQLDREPAQVAADLRVLLGLTSSNSTDTPNIRASVITYAAR